MGVSPQQEQTRNTGPAVGLGWRVHVGEGSCLWGVRNDCFLIFNLSNGPHLLYHRWSCERTPRGPRAALTEHMPLLQNFNCAAISKEPRCLILAPHGWTQEGAEPEQKSTEAISLRATSDGVCLAKRGLSVWCKWNSTALLTLDKPGSRGSSRPPPSRHSRWAGHKHLCRVGRV